MKTKVKFIISAMFSIAVLGACANNQSQQGHDQTSTGQNPPTVTADAVSGLKDPQLKDAVLNAILPYYNSLQEALVAGERNQAKEAALLLEEGAKKLPKGTADIAQATGQVLQGEDIESQRQAFALLSEQYIALIKASGLTQGTLYVAHCPMAFDHQGANWLSMNKSLKNPYFGEKMLSCGSVEETLD